MAHTAAPGTVGTVRYTVRQFSTGPLRIQKWEVGRQAVSYFISDDGWFQRCTCPGSAQFHRICRHIRLCNVLSSGRLRSSRYYVFDGVRWMAGAPDVDASQRAVKQVNR